MPIGTIFETADSVFDVVSDLWSGDKGHAQGKGYIPGDLQSRFNKVDQYMKARGLSLIDIDYDRVYEILTSYGIWQNNVQDYLNQVRKQIDAGTYINPNIPKQPITIKPPITTPFTDTNTPIASQAGLGSNLLFIVIIIGIAVYSLK